MAPAKLGSSTLQQLSDALGLKLIEYEREYLLYTQDVRGSSPLTPILKDMLHFTIDELHSIKSLIMSLISKGGAEMPPHCSWSILTGNGQILFADKVVVDQVLSGYLIGFHVDTHHGIQLLPYLLSFPN